MKRILFRVALGAVFLLLLGLGTLWIFIDPLVRSAIERGGTLAAGVPTSVESVDVGLVSPHFELAGLRIADPPGFGEHFLKLGRVRTTWAEGSLFSERIVIDELNIEDLELALVHSARGSNWKPILDSLERLGGGEAASKPESAGDGPGRSLHLRKLVIRGARASLTLSDMPLGLGGTGTRSLELPPIVIEDLKSDGSVAELTAVVLRSVLAAALQRTLQGGPGVFDERALSALRGDFSSLGKQLGQELDRLLSDPQSAEGLIEGVKSLFDRK